MVRLRDHNITQLLRTNVARVASNATAVHPAWRKSIHHLALTTAWDTNTTFLERQLRRGQMT
ncbi:hypothetical protein CPB86DRAFT_867028 [Serendipita vermifera]|nr:hypothetical protein CPB86DRAFT_867028 [Serendipita vermifera]